jgi:signal transduction histidine kinase
VPDEQGVLRVLVSEGHKADYDRTLSIAADNPTSPSAMALRECRPVQLIAGVSDFFPPIAHAEGFRALLALPIISRHVGGVVLVVYRACANPFSVNEIGLLLAFANHATLAWEHAVLYERSDERLREIASENQRLYHEAQQERQQLAAIMGSMEDGLVLARDDGTVLYANRGASTLLELAYPAPVGQPIETVYAALQRLGDPPTPLSLPESRSHSQLVALRRAGQPAWVQLRAFAVVGPTNELIGHGLLLRDVTHEREIDQFKTTLLGAVGHELRTPLAAIKGHASTLLQEDVHWSPAEQRHFLRTINDEADRLTLLVRNLLDLARLEAGLLALHCMPWPLPLLVQRSLKRLPTLVDRTIVVDLPPELPPVLVDSQRIEVVIDNLLNNALLYGGDTIHIKATAHAEQIVLAVIDNGEGLPAGELPHLFERFYRARQNSQRHVGGSGLGLAICKAFVEAHGGRIWVESGPHTTSFICTLPLAQNHDEPDHLATKSDVVNEETAVSRQ